MDASEALQRGVENSHFTASCLDRAAIGA